MAERFNIYAGPPITRVLEQAGRDNKSGRMNDIAARYDAIITHELARLRLTEKDWCAIVDANNGAVLGDDVGWRSTWANVMDSPELADKWDVNPIALANRLRVLPLPAQAAVTEIVERFWSSPKLNTMSAGQLLGEIGAVFTLTEEATDVAP